MKPFDFSTVDTEQPTEPPLPLRLLEQYGISKSGIARQLGITPNRIGKALEVETFGSIKHRDLARIRRQIEKLVEAAGWKGKNDTLWKEYDQHLENAA